jgi:3-oxoacyl-[acyl-carrier protein] reductase
VLVTAAAGTGIRFATAKRCVEGARVVISDKHERRLGESATALGVPGIPCDVTQEAEYRRCSRRQHRSSAGSTSS